MMHVTMKALLLKRVVYGCEGVGIRPMKTRDKGVKKINVVRSHHSHVLVKVSNSQRITPK